MKHFLLCVKSAHTAGHNLLLLLPPVCLTPVPVFELSSHKTSNVRSYDRDQHRNLFSLYLTGYTVKANDRNINNNYN